MHIGGDNPRKYCTIGRTILEKISEERDLRIYITEDFEPSLQRVKAAKKASSALGIIKRSFNNFDTFSFASVYKTYVRCHMEYCVQAWKTYKRKIYKF